MEYQSSAINAMDCIKRGYTLVSEYLSTYILMTFAAAVIVGFTSYVMTTAVGYLMPLVSATPEGATEPLRTFASILLDGAANVLPEILRTLAVAGFLITLHKQSRGEVISVGDVLSGVGFFGSLFIVALLNVLAQSGPALLVFIAGNALGVPSGTEAMYAMLRGNGPLGLAAALMFLVEIIRLGVNCLWFAISLFVVPLIVLRGFPVGKAIGVSIKSGAANLLQLCVLAVLQVLLLMAGFLACLIGALIALPVAVASTFVAFEDVFGRLDDESELNPPPPPAYGGQIEI